MFTLQVRKLFRKTLLFWSTTPQRRQPKHPPTRLALEALEDRTLLSVTSLPVVSSQAESPLAVATSSLFALVEQRVQQFATILQDASNVVNALNWEIVQEVAALQLQVGHLLGFDTNTPTPSSNAAVLQPSSESGASQGRASGFGSSSGAATKAHDDPHPRLEKAVPLTDSGVGSGSPSGPYSGNATVTGQVWLDNNADASLDNGEMGYSGATVDLLKSTDSGQSWSFAGSTTTSAAKEDYNYSLPTGFPLPNDWLYKIQVVFPQYFAATTPSAQSKIDTQGFSTVFSLAAGAVEVIPAGLVSMNVNTTDDDPNGPQLQQVLQNKVTLRDAIQTGNKLKPFPEVTFYTNPQTGQQLSGSIGLQAVLDPIEKSYSIDGPGSSTLTVQGDGFDDVFAIDSGVVSAINNLSITSGFGQDGGGIYNLGDLTLSYDNIYRNLSRDSGGGVFNARGAQLTLNASTVANNRTNNLGGGIGNSGTLSICCGSQIYSNEASDGGGLGNSNTGRVIITSKSSIYNNQATDNGGGIADNTGIVSLSSGSIKGNTANTTGGGIFCFAGSVTLTNAVTVSKNTAVRGGGVFSSGGQIKMTGGAISSNKATAYDGAPGGGGGVFVSGGSLALTSVSVSSNKVSGGNGAGVFSRGNVNIVGGKIQLNSGGNGAGIWIGGGTVTESGVTMEFNTAASDCNGGGIYNMAGTLTLKGGVYVGAENSATQGGGMYLAIGSTTTFNLVTVSGNVASNGGPGVYWQVVGNQQATVLPNPPGPPALSDQDDPNGKPVKGP